MKEWKVSKELNKEYASRSSLKIDLTHLCVENRCCTNYDDGEVFDTVWFLVGIKLLYLLIYVSNYCATFLWQELALKKWNVYRNCFNILFHSIDMQSEEGNIARFISFNLFSIFKSKLATWCLYSYFLKTFTKVFSKHLLVQCQ